MGAIQLKKVQQSSNSYQLQDQGYNTISSELLAYLVK